MKRKRSHRYGLHLLERIFEMNGDRIIPRWQCYGEVADLRRRKPEPKRSPSAYASRGQQADRVPASATAAGGCTPAKRRNVKKTTLLALMRPEALFYDALIAVCSSTSSSTPKIM